jgi:integrase/recombinase XerD
MTDLSLPSLVPAMVSPSPVDPTSALPSHSPQGLVLRQIGEACQAWLLKSPSADTRSNYSRDLGQFLRFCGAADNDLATLASVRPQHVSAWRDSLMASGLSNSSVRRKLTVLRSLFSYLQTYGYVGANPAHSDFVQAPPVPRDGKTVALTANDCRKMLDYPSHFTLQGIRDRALFAVLAFTGCRVGEVARLRIGDYQQHGGHRILNIRGKGGKERRVPLHPEAIERIELWLDASRLRGELSSALFRPLAKSRDEGASGFAAKPLTRRAIQKLVETAVDRLGLDPHVSVHSFRVTALTTARERGSDIIDLQDFAGHADPRTTLGYIRNRDRLKDSPAYLLRY